MGLLNMTPQRESRLKLALPEQKQALALQLIDVLQKNPIGVHVPFSKIIELCKIYGSVGEIVAHLTKNIDKFSLAGIGELIAEVSVEIGHVKDAYMHARMAMECYNKKFPVSIKEIIEGIDNTPTCWEFTGYREKVWWETSDNVVIKGKNLGTYRVGLKVNTWQWSIYSNKYSDNCNYPHPHVSSDNYPCYGNAAGLMTAEKGIVKNLEGLWAFLHQYNASSAYRKLYKF